MKGACLLKGVVFAGATASMPITASEALNPVFSALQKAEFPMPEFKSVLGEGVLILSADGVAHNAEIAEVQELNYHNPEHVRPNYLRSCATAVRFHVLDTQPCSNNNFQLNHSTLGKMDLLLSVVPDANGNLGLEAVFN
jgi:hypothetical protein